MERYTRKFGGNSGLKDRYCIKAKEVSVIDGKLVGKVIDRLAELEERETPKKCEIYTATQPRMTYDDEVDVYVCPNCGVHIGVADENNRYSFCFECGQHLDWSDYEE